MKVKESACCIECGNSIGSQLVEEINSGPYTVCKECGKVSYLHYSEIED